MNESAEFKELIFVRYVDHVAFNRSSALVMQPQTREAVGWLVYECDQYLTLMFDRDAMPPTLKGGDPKASGLVLLKSDILKIRRFCAYSAPLKETSECHLNSQETTSKTEYALQANGAKNSKKKRKPS